MLPGYSKVTLPGASYVLTSVSPLPSCQLTGPKGPRKLSDSVRTC